MTQPQPHETPTSAESQATDDPGRSPLIRTAIWVAIGALIAAAIVCVVWVLIGPENGIVARAFLTVLLLAGFAGAAILDANLAPNRPAWLALASMGVWVVTLLIGAVMIWMPERFAYSGFGRFVSFLLIVLILQLALLHIRLFLKALARNRTTFTSVIAIVTIVLVIALAIMLVIPLMLSEYAQLGDLYWRFVVSITILAAVGTALLPLMNVLFAPRRPRPQPVAPAYAGYPGYPAAGGQQTGVIPAWAPHAPQGQTWPGQAQASWQPQAGSQGQSAPQSFAPASAAPIPAAPVPAAPASAPVAPAPRADASDDDATAPHAAESAPAPASAAPVAAASSPAAPAPTEGELLPWPMYADGRTPLPMLPDGSPDWQAYQTGRPSPGAQSFVPIAPEQASQPTFPPPVPSPGGPRGAQGSPGAHGYEGFPPPPPLPPRN
ncbi:hypothetical protein QSU92_04260 [Microbacterium sp. ET2]|uniref:hypothetical protein n=1 Tax=Microbacterium albipurpureum TaxID=3050384 RepID=UPI00259D1AD2|nr:hypothetical protein [Microbacterium sp. ET2 (Ac-2212)]WJL96406.1 hypothetical protein QSU92_04260 [Microbacterium sp. ET2 (Ac-2212)]